jgi:large subunit ribosomal protein L44e
MKVPKTRKTYCPKCKKHTLHNVTESKQKTFGSAHPMSKGTRAQQRHLARFGNCGRFSRKPIKQRKMFGKKQTRKANLLFECTVCKKSHFCGESFRARKVEFT